MLRANLFLLGRPLIAAATAKAHSISSLLPIGAAFLLFGSALTMAAPLNFYEKKRWTRRMERAGRMFAFIGADAVFIGTILELKGKHLAIAAVLLLLAFAGFSAILLLPVFVPIHPRSKDESGKARQANKGKTISFALTVYGLIKTDGDKSGGPQDGDTDPQPVADPQPEANVQRRRSFRSRVRRFHPRNLRPVRLVLRVFR